MQLKYKINKGKKNATVLEDGGYNLFIFIFCFFLQCFLFFYNRQRRLDTNHIKSFDQTRMRVVPS